MKRCRVIALALCLSARSVTCAWREVLAQAVASDPTMAAASEVGGSGLKYPQLEKGDVVDEIHGVQIADPYRVLEEPESETTKDWVKSQVRLLACWLAAIARVS